MNWYGGGSVVRAPLSGGTPLTLTTGPVALFAPIAVDGTSVYWATDSQIMKMTPK